MTVGPRRRARSFSRLTPYMFIAPVVILFSIFTIYPIIASFLLSFQTRQAGSSVFAGLANYARLISDDYFLTALLNNFTILAIQVPVQLVLALLIAVGLKSALVRFKGAFRVAYFMPAITALVAYSVVFVILLNTDFGLVNYFLHSILKLPKIDWLANPFWAKVGLMMAITWRWTGYNMVIMLAGLQQIPGELYEAANIDGAGTVQRFFRITVPMLKPIILFTFILSTIGTLQLFDEPYILTKGGPNNATLTAALYIYRQGFQYFDFGYASAISYVLVAIIAVLSWFQLKIGGADSD